MPGDDPKHTLPKLKDIWKKLREQHEEGLISDRELHAKMIDELAHSHHYTFEQVLDLICDSE